MKQTLKKQRGLSLMAVIFGGGVLFAVALLGMKVFPEYMTYFTTLQNIKATAQDPGLRGASVAQVRGAYLKRLQVQGGGDVGPDDLDISKEGNEIVISFAYSKKIHLFSNVNLMIDFAGSSSGS